MAAPFASSSLYVGDLDPEVTEANLFELFNSIGAVASIRVCRDAITRRSLGYAYVNFHNTADAERALDQLNGTALKGKPLRIMWTQRDPSLRKSGKGNIFIKNLDKSIDHKALYDTFSQFGQILSCKIELDDNHQSKGYGYIQFATSESAEESIQKVNGMMLNNKKVFVGLFVPKKERIAANSQKKFTNIYIKNLDPAVEEEKLREMFNPFGEIQSAVIMKDEQGKSKGFAFINYAQPEQAEKAVDEMNNKDINGKTLFVGRAQKRQERDVELRQKFEQMKMEQMSKYQGVNLYIKNLDDEIDDDKLRGLFTPFGTITSCVVMKDNKGISKGFGFVCYTNPEEATRAVTDMNGKIVGSKPLFVALAQRKDVRRAQLEVQFAQRKQVVVGAPRIPAPMYNGAPPMFYAQAPGQPYVYPQMVPARGGRFPPPGPYQMPGYVIVNARGQVKNARGNVVQPRRGGVKGGQPVPAPAVPLVQPVVVPQPTPIAPAEAIPLTPQYINQFPAEEQKQIIGERLYVLIAKTQPQLAAKITGMILDSSYPEEMLHLIESPEALTEKVDEALNVLKEHNVKAE